MDRYRELYHYASFLVALYAQKIDGQLFLKISSLDEDDLGKFATLWLEYYERDTSDCFHNPDQYAKDDDITCALIGLLKSNTPDNQIEFANLVRKNTIKRFYTQMQDLIDEICTSSYYETMDSMGLRSYRDRTNGEVMWR